MNESQKPTGRLVISRHAESAWNQLGKWTGWTDIGLSDQGKSDSVLLGGALRDINFAAAYTSELTRTKETLDGILEGKSDQLNLPRIAAAALNERDYGDLTGKNKWEVQEEIGEEAFNGIRRGWDYPVPGGETLKDVHTRAWPYFVSEILPRLHSGENILLVAHGNSIRALMKELDDVPEDQMSNVEMPIGTLLVYTFGSEGARPLTKEVRVTEATSKSA